jgi:hypothetical protein
MLMFISWVENSAVRASRPLTRIWKEPPISLHGNRAESLSVWTSVLQLGQGDTMLYLPSECEACCAVSWEPAAL